MKKFLVIYHATAEVLGKMATATPEERAASVKPWMVWKEKIGDHLVNFGTPLMGGMKMNPDGTAIPSSKEVSGFSIIQATNMAEAQKLLVDHPHTAWAEGCEIEVHEFIGL